LIAVTVLQSKILVVGLKARPEGATAVPSLYVMLSLTAQLLGLSVNAGTVYLSVPETFVTAL
jgi:hypothetical protein